MGHAGAVWYRMAFIVLFLLSSCATPPQGETEPPPTVEVPPKPASYRLVSEDGYIKVIGQNHFCTVIWRVGKKTADLSLQSLCQKVSLKKQLPLINNTLLRLARSRVTGLYKEKYQVSLCCFDEFDQRLSLAAYRSKVWDSKRGRAKNLSEPEAMNQLMKDGALFPEFEVLFKRFGFDIERVRTHRVGRIRANRASYYEWLKGQGVADNSILPADPVVYWDIRKSYQPAVSNLGN